MNGDRKNTVPHTAESVSLSLRLREENGAVSRDNGAASRNGPRRDGAAFRAALTRGPVLFDGAMGTFYASRYGHSADWCDMASLNRPEEISAIHQSYLDAGAQAVKTNTFSVSRYLSQGNTDLARRILEAGCRIAREAAEPRGAFVFGDIGPAPEEGAGAVTPFDIPPAVTALSAAAPPLPTYPLSAAAPPLSAAPPFVDSGGNVTPSGAAASPDSRETGKAREVPETGRIQGVSETGKASAFTQPEIRNGTRPETAKPSERKKLSPAEIYIRQADIFLDQGVTCFLAETLSSDEGLSELARHIKARCPDAFLLVSFAVGADRLTRDGYAAEDLLCRASDCGDIDAAGFNCVSGPEHLLQLTRGVRTSLPLSVMPNAGYPGTLGRHTVFQGQPDYFGKKLREIAAAGAVIVGGCCGTTPAHIAAAASALRSFDATAVKAVNQTPSGPVESTDPFGGKLEAGQRVIAVELDPPADDDGGFFLDGARRLRDAGADIITIADCPVGRARADSSLMACMLKREGVEPLPHMTCRDRNLNAVKALLLGLAIGDVRNILLITGDPIPTENRAEIKSVFNFNSRKLARYISGLHGNGIRTPFRLFGALNVNARNFDAQLFAAKEKEAGGMAGFLTQPVLSPEALDNLIRARETLRGKILGGIFPVVSYKNAVFLNNEVPGIRVSEEIIARYEGRTREEREDLAVELSVRTAADIAPWTDGLYLVTPFRRVALMERILAEIGR